MNIIAAGQRVALRRPSSAPQHQQSLQIQRHRRAGNLILRTLFACLFPLLTLSCATANATQTLPGAGLIMHLDSTLGVQMTNQSISYWWDQSGTGGDLRANGRPTLVNNVLNGLPVIELDSASDALHQFRPATLPALDNDRTLIILSSATDSETTVGYGAQGCGAAFKLGQSPDGASSLNTGCASGKLYSRGKTPAGAWNLHILLLRAGSLIHLRNGELVDGRTPSLATQIGQFGIETITQSPSSKLRLATIMAYNWALGSPEVEQVQRYIGSKWFGNPHYFQTPPNLQQLALPQPHIEMRQARKANQQLEITWRVSFADSCQSDTGWSSSSATTGSAIIDGRGTHRSYGLNCWHRTASASSHLSTATKPVEITWQNPLGQEKLIISHRLFVGRESRRYDHVVPIKNKITNSHRLELTPGRYYIAMSTIGHDGRESVLSGELAITVD